MRFIKNFAATVSIVVLGTCDEAVEIRSSDVTIEGHADGGAIIQSGSGAANRLPDAASSLCCIDLLPETLLRPLHSPQTVI